MQRPREGGEPGSLRVELYLLRGGSHVLVCPDEKGTVRSLVLGVAFGTVHRPKLTVTWEDGSAQG